MKIDWGASFFFSLMLLFYGMAFFKPPPVKPTAGMERRAAAIEYRPNTESFPDWIPGERPEISMPE